MKKILMLTSLAFGFLAAATAHATIFPKVVDKVDLTQYLGTWYEVASTKPSFQANCVCTTANYALRDDGLVAVTNICRKGTVDGKIDIANGIATPTSHPAKLKVSFGGFSLPFSTYWIVDLAEDYSYAVVTTPLRNPIWVLSREPHLDEEIYSKILTKLDAEGYNLRRLTPSLQDGCSESSNNL